jgi:hypothetical protein
MAVVSPFRPSWQCMPTPRVKSSAGIFKFLSFLILGPCQSLENGDEELTSVTEFCAEFSQSQVPLQTLVRLSGTDFECPFIGDFTFTYKTGNLIGWSHHTLMTFCNVQYIYRSGVS